MNLSVLGCNGFIGANLVGVLSEKYEISGIGKEEFTRLQIPYIQTNDQFEGVKEFLANKKIDVVINASGSGSVPVSLKNPPKDLENNVLSVSRILDIISNLNPQIKYIHLSSAAVYGNPVELPVREDSVIDPISPYGLHKMMSEQLCEYYNHHFNIPVAILRPFSVYGRGQQKQILWDLYCKFSSNKMVELYGTGSESRDFLHVEDLAELLNCVIRKSNFNCNIYNAATGVESTIQRVANCFAEELGMKGKVKFTGIVRQGDPKNWCADISKIEQLGFKPAIHLENGIRDFIEWAKTLKK